MQIFFAPCRAHLPGQFASATLEEVAGPQGGCISGEVISVSGGIGI